MNRVLRIVGTLVQKEEGQDLLEYCLLAVLIAVTALAAVSSVANAINAVLWESIAQNL